MAYNVEMQETLNVDMFIKAKGDKAFREVRDKIWSVVVKRCPELERDQPFSKIAYNLIDSGECIYSFVSRASMTKGNLITIYTKVKEKDNHKFKIHIEVHEGYLHDFFQ